jgi:hypothetical protein
VIGCAQKRGIVIAGGLAALALALAFVTLAMNQTASHAQVHTVLSLKARAAAAAASGKKTAAPAVKPKPKRVDPNLTAALQAGLPRTIARALAAKPVAVVELTSNDDPVAQLARGEAQSGAKLGGASFVPVDVDADGGAVAVLTRLLGKLPVAPAVLVYTRPGTLALTLPGFNDRTTVQQAAADAAQALRSAVPAPTTPVAPAVTATPKASA